MDRKVIITGASSGLGLCLTERFVEAGDTVYGVSRTQKNWKEAKERVSDPKHFSLHRADVSSEAQVKSLVSKIRKRAGRIDILINNAGYADPPTPLEKESLREFQNNISANLLSVFLMCKHALPIFKAQKKGWIINISSMAGKRAVPFLAAYSASKFGVLALSQSIAKENSNGGLRCITVCPGGMNTGMRARLFGREDADRQQTPDFVADKIMEILEGKIPVEPGGDVVIRHSQVTAINPPPEA